MPAETVGLLIKNIFKAFIREKHTHVVLSCPSDSTRETSQSCSLYAPPISITRGCCNVFSTSAYQPRVCFSYSTRSLSATVPDQSGLSVLFHRMFNNDVSSCSNDIPLDEMNSIYDCTLKLRDISGQINPLIESGTNQGPRRTFVDLEPRTV